MAHYWRLGEASGARLWDSVGSADATADGVTLGASGALTGDDDAAARFDGTTSVASAPVNLSGTHTATVEFWLKWSAYANDDDLAMEFTPNFNSMPGGFLVDPNAPQGGGKFAVSLGDTGSRNGVTFERPSAGAWHHYAFILDTSAPAADQIIPYVDGETVAFDKLASNTGAGNFADSVLHFMSRNSSTLLGAGDLDDLAIYTTKLNATTVHEHYNDAREQLEPAVTSPPEISGDAVHGATLTSTTGTWAGASPLTFARRWLRCGAQTGGCQPISDATGASYELGAQDVGKTIRVRVTATNVHGSAEATSAESAVIDPAVAPAATGSRPSFAVAEVVDHDPVTATVGNFTGSRPLTYSHRWELCRHNPDLDCQRIVGTGYSETGNAPRIAAVDASLYGPGATLRLVVTATNPAGSASMISDELAVLPRGWILRDDPLPFSTEGIPAVPGDQFIEGNLARGGWTVPANNPTRPYSSAGTYLRCADTTLASCNPIVGTDSGDINELSYRITASDIGSYLRVKKTVTNPAGSVTGYTAPRLVAHSRPQWLDFNASSSSGGFTAHWSGLAHKKGPRNTDSGFWSFQLHDDLSWRPGRWIGDTPLDSEDDTIVEWRSSNGLLLHTGRTWTIDRPLPVGSTLVIREYRTNAVGTNHHDFATGTSIDPATVVAPTNLTPPRIVGRPAPREGDTLTPDYGTWNDGDGELTFSPTWFRCDTDGENCTSVTTGPGVTYDPTVQDNGKVLRVRLTASNSAGSVTLWTPATQPVWIRPYRLAIADDVAATNNMYRTVRVYPDLLYPHVTFPIRIDIGQYQLDEEWTLETVASGLRPPPIGADPDYDDPMLVYLDEDVLLGDMGHRFGGGAGFGLRSDGCLYGSFGYDREFSLNYCVPALEPVNTRHHFAMTYSGGDVTFYVDGAPTAAHIAMAPPRPGGEPDEPDELDLRLPLSIGSRARAGYGDTVCSGEPPRCEAGWYTQKTNVFTGTIGDATYYPLALATSRLQLHASLLAQDRDPNGPANTSAPTLSGVEHDGRELTAGHGAWSGATPMSYAHQWQRCGADATGCTNIAQATLSTYRLSGDDIGHTVRVVLTATNVDGIESAPSGASGVIAAGAPISTVHPVITGTATDGEQLFITTGTWVGTVPQTYAYQWRRCDGTGDACEDVDGATAPEYTLAHEDVGYAMRAVVTAENGEGSSAATSDATDAVAAAAPTATAGPVISGVMKVGETLSSTLGTWAGTPPITFTRQWQRCDAAGGECDAITGATDATYTLAVADAGSEIRVRVSATNAAGSHDEDSEPTAIVTRRPANTVAPTVSGTAQDGRRVTAVTGTWIGTTPIATAVHWQRCDGEGGDCANVEGAMARTYDLAPADVGYTLRVVETATNAAGATSHESATTDAVEPAPPTNRVVPKIGGITQPGGQLHAHTGSWNGTPPITYTYQWRLCDQDGADCVDLDGQTDSTFDVGTGQLGHTLRAVVTATNAAGTAPVTTAPTRIVSGFSAAIAGDAREYQVLKAVPADLIADDPASFSYQWQSCGPPGEDCADIEDATRRTYTLGAGDVGTTVRVTIAAAAGSVTASAQSETTPTVRNAVPTLVVPIVFGWAAQGHMLTTTDAVGPPSASFSYQWERCDTQGQSCVPISEATGTAHAVGAADIGSRLRVTVTATNSGGSISASSKPTTVVPNPTLLNTAAPRVTRHSSPDGDVMTADAGDWTGTAPISYRFQWQRCDTNGTRCANIADATDADYHPGEPDVGATLRALVTASNTEGSDDARSAASAPIVASAPSNATEPSLSGQASVRQLLWADNGSWSGIGAMRFAYQWQRCDASGADCHNVEDQTDPTYQQGVADLGSTLRVSVTATNLSGSATSTSPASTIVTDVPATPGSGPVNTTPPSLTGDPQVGQTLTVDRGVWQSAGTIEYAYEWERCDASGLSCAAIRDADGESYVTTADDLGTFVRAVIVATDANDTAVATAPASQSIRSADGPANDALPVLSGTMREGQQVAVSTGEWSGESVDDFTYEWQRCEMGPDACDPIEGATNATYQLTGDEVGGTVRVAVTAKDAGQVETTAISSRSETIAPAAPRNSDAPSISGGAETGDTLHAATGSWAGISPIAYAYQWQSCDGAGEDCAELAGATQADYVLSEGDVGSTLRVTVTASNGDGHHEATSAAYGPIASSGAPVPTGPPTLSLGAFEGRAIVVDHGAWSGTGTITYTYQWQSCDTAGDRCSTIADATTDGYTPQADDVGSTVRAAVTAHDDAGARTILTDASLTIQPASPDAPSHQDLVNSAPPTISGDVRHGRTVSADPGGWTGSTAISFAYQWRSCDTAGKHCAAIDEANAASYTIGAAQVGRRLRVSVTASNGWGTHTAISEPTVAVTHAQPTNTALPSLSGDFVDGQTLNADDGTWLGSDLAFDRQWQRCDADGLNCADIAGATDTSYQLTADDAGQTIRITIMATNHLGVESASSPPSSVVAALAPASQAAPQIYGLAMQDGTLYADPGAWNGTPQLSFAYQWQSCDQDGENCADITGAIQATYTLGLGDVATRLRAAVTATNTAGQSSVTSDATDAIAPANEPVLIDGQPSITGDLHDGQQLTADPGPWHGVEPMAYAYQWKRCDTNGEQCVDIAGATAQTRNLSVDDLGSTLRVAVTAANPTGSGHATTDPTDVVATAPPSNVTPPYVSGDARPGQELTVAHPGEWSGSMPMTYSYQWERCDRYTQDCENIADATSSAYTVGPSDSRHAVRVMVTATNTHGYASESSYASYVSALRPQNVGLPTISGTARVGQQLSAEAGEWSPDADNYGYQWQACAPDGTSCSDLQWQTSSHFTPWLDQAGKTIRVVVSGQNAYDADPPTATSAATAPVATTAPYNVTAPALSTTSPVMDQPINATSGTWTGQEPLAYSYQWQSCYPWAGASSCGDINGATEATYLPASYLVGYAVRVRVTVINAYDVQVAYSELSDAVVEGPPRNLVAPTVTGSVVVGARLDVDAGSWTGVVDWDVQWMRCDGQGEECHDRPGIEGGYVVGRADLGATLRAKVTGRSDVGQLTVTTEPSDVVSAATRPVNDVRPSITGTPAIGDTLRADSGSWSGSPDITYDYDWQRCDSDGDPCESLGDPPGTPSDYLPRRADAGSTLRVAVTATNGGGSVTVRSAPTEVVPDPVPLSNVNLPSAGGGWPYYVSYGNKIRDSGSGVWAGEPELADQWQRCDPLTANPGDGAMQCVDIVGATDATKYVPQAADVGFKLRIKETATTPDDTQTVFSDPTPDRVWSGIADDGGSFAGVPVAGETITGHDTATSPAGLPITTSYAFQRVADDWSTTTLQDDTDASYVLTDDDIGHRVFIDMTVSMWRADHATVVNTRRLIAKVPVVQPRIGNELAPAISGETRVGSTLTTTDGTWHGGAGSPDYTYRWQRCDADGHDCLDIPGATTADYRLAIANLGKTVRVVVTASTGTAQASAVSDPSGPVVAADVPGSVIAPAIAGTAAERQTLTADRGEWTGSAPLTYTYQWQRCDEDANTCDDIDGATSTTHVPDESDVGSTLRVVVTATNAAGNATAAANATAVVAPAPARTSPRRRTPRSSGPLPPARLPSPTAGDGLTSTHRASATNGSVATAQAARARTSTMLTRPATT